MPTVVSLMCEGPARTYGIHPRKGSLAPDSDADIVLVDPQASREVRREDVRSRAGWSAFEGRQLVGAAVRTFVRGQTVWSDGEVLAPVGHGRYIPR